jgi:hypothetical protein
MSVKNGRFGDKCVNPLHPLPQLVTCPPHATLLVGFDSDRLAVQVALRTCRLKRCLRKNARLVETGFPNKILKQNHGFKCLYPLVI